MKLLHFLAAIAAFLSTVGAFQVPHMSQRRLHSRALNSAVMDDVTTTKESTGTRSLPPLLQDMADERREFEMNLGKAMDTLRKDYPTMLHKTPGTNEESISSSHKLYSYPNYIILTLHICRL